ncbi:MAG: GNAT family N-acetyltransferase [Dehalococcoidia bacterium]|nr:GNAT family N-acetyltransferase [Dehalococcoidia bacterium]
MATHLTWRTADERRGIRAFNLRRDLAGVIDLVLLAFADEPERSTGQSSHEDLRALKQLSHFVWLTSLFSDQTREFFAGQVWEEDGKIIGNASVSKLGRDGSRWLIGNVATYPEYRRRGIARSLVLAAIDFVRAQQGEFVVLDVRADNRPAYDLYLSLGFTHITGTTELKLTGHGESTADMLDFSRGENPSFLRPNFRSLRWSDWQPVYELARAATPSAAQPFSPVRLRDYEMGTAGHLFNELSHFLARRKEYRLVALDGRRPVAFLDVSIRGIKMTHRVRTIIHPDYRGRVEPALVSRAMEILRYHPWNSVWAEIPCEQTDQIAALKKCGFKETVTQHRLGLRVEAPIAGV